MSAYVMNEFSDRTVARLKRNKLFKLLLPAFTSFLKVNVNKEIEKDRQIILHARDLSRDGKSPEKNDTDYLLDKAREIDRKFLQDISTLASSIIIHYEDIEQYRRKRIERMLDLVCEIMREWDQSSGFRTAVTSLFTRDQFTSAVREIFDLYINETRMLSQSVKIPRRLLFTRDALISKVGSVMEDVAGELADEMSDRVYLRAGG